MLRRLSTNIVELANEGHGEASREAGDKVHCGKDGVKLYPDRISGDVVARGVGGIRG